MATDPLKKVNDAPASQQQAQANAAQPTAPVQNSVYTLTPEQVMCGCSMQNYGGIFGMPPMIDFANIVPYPTSLYSTFNCSSLATMWTNMFNSIAARFKNCNPQTPCTTGTTCGVTPGFPNMPTMPGMNFPSFAGLTAGANATANVTAMDPAVAKALAKELVKQQCTKYTEEEITTFLTKQGEAWTKEHLNIKDQTGSNSGSGNPESGAPGGIINRPDYYYLPPTKMGEYMVSVNINKTDKKHITKDAFSHPIDDENKITHEHYEGYHPASGSKGEYWDKLTKKLPDGTEEVYTIDADGNKKRVEQPKANGEPTSQPAATNEEYSQIPTSKEYTLYNQLQADKQQLADLEKLSTQSGQDVEQHDYTGTSNDHRPLPFGNDPKMYNKVIELRNKVRKGEMDYRYLVDKMKPEYERLYQVFALADAAYQRNANDKDLKSVRDKALTDLLNARKELT